MAINLIDYMSPSRVIFPKAKTKEGVIEELIEVAEKDGKVEDASKMKKYLLQREEIVSTGIGFGVAIPHVKVPEVNDFFITIGIHKEGVDWGSLDNKPAYIIFMIIGPDNQQEKYLRILAKLTLVIRNPNRREKLQKSNSPEEVLAIFKDL